MEGAPGAHGTLVTTGDGRFALRFERRLGHPRAKVWRALTEADQLRAWFAQILDYDRFRLDPRAGAEIAFVPRAGLGLPAGRGEVLRADPPRLLEYTWDAETLRWELEADGETGCLLVLTNIFGDRDSAVALGAGWHAGLDLLAALLDGRPAEPPAMEPLLAGYERALG
ncbi:hypothetical protein Misp01_21310 [Microtetraspora sp. NBRC 13810]|nr:hypothetical protein Misp01_21310 [Microtetraspora sp. NBRC 13810]